MEIQSPPRDMRVRQTDLTLGLNPDIVF